MCQRGRKQEASVEISCQSSQGTLSVPCDFPKRGTDSISNIYTRMSLCSHIDIGISRAALPLC